MASETAGLIGAEWISLLRRVSRIVSSGLSLDEMLGEIIELAARVSGCDACVVYLMETGSGEFFFSECREMSGF